VIIEDHPLVREALQMRLVAAFGEIDFAYSGESLRDALAAIVDEPADCAILDLDLGDGRSPVLNTSDLVESGTPVLIVSALADPATVRAALQVGALGFVSKQTPTDELMVAVEATLQRQPSTSRDVAAILYSDESTTVQLTDRERLAMVLYASGMKIETVARRMGVKPATASEYIKRVREKYLRAGTPVPTKTDLYRQARGEGLVP
jgi:DNA-binding NarL/FixJ family response regulator